MKLKFDEHFDSNTDDWIDGEISAGERQLLYAKWLDEA